MKKASKYTSDLLPVFLCFANIESIPSMDMIISKSILEAQLDIVEHIKSLTNDKNMLERLDMLRKDLV